jgi:hypothetical protein
VSVHSRERSCDRCFGKTDTICFACSARVVSHHLGGFLRFTNFGLVASRCRSWGSSRFQHYGLPRDAGSYPSKNFPPPEPRCITATLATVPFRRLRGFAPCRSLESRCAVEGATRPGSSWAWVPFQILRSLRGVPWRRIPSTLPGVNPTEVGVGIRQNRKLRSAPGVSMLTGGRRP